MQFKDVNAEKWGAERAAPALHPIFRGQSISTA
jgi:hypothetical protein